MDKAKVIKALGSIFDRTTEGLNACLRPKGITIIELEQVHAMILVEVSSIMDELGEGSEFQDVVNDLFSLTEKIPKNRGLGALLGKIRTKAKNLKTILESQ